MDKIGDYIPLIIIALSFIYSFAKKAGKKAEEKEVGGTTLPKKDLSENAEPWPQVNPRSKRQLQQNPQVVIERNQTSVSEERKWDFLETIPDNVFSGEMEVASALEINPIIGDGKVIEADKSGIQLCFGDKDELKKGILYAEIFNRKY